MIANVHPQSVLFITLDSCRFDTFESARVPSFKSIGPLHKALAPATFTYASHMAMFVGFTPGIPTRPEPYVNPKFGKIFKMTGIGHPGKGTEYMQLQGRNIIDGLKRKGYLAIGSGAVPWFNPATETSKGLIEDFDHYFFAGNRWSIGKQLDFVASHLPSIERPVFVFINVGETHIPYYYDGAPWRPDDNPCLAFGESNNAAECRRRQTACVEHVDQVLAPLVQAFANATTLVCADHGDCWGEDGLWDHGIHHPKVYEVPLLFRLAPRT
jgi:hypothetical protein